MASLAEAGLSQNIGIYDQPVCAPEQQAISIHNNVTDPFRLRYRQGSGFALPEGFDVNVTNDSVLDLGKSLGSTATFKEPFSSLLHPVFVQPYGQYEHRYPAEDTVVCTTSAEAELTSRGYLDAMVDRSEDLRSRAPTYLFLGHGAVESFMVSALGLLDIAGKHEMATDKDGFMRLVGDDFLASRLIQLAGISGTDLRAAIPPSHLERALKELIVTTFANNYAFLDSIEKVDRISGAWHVGAMRFARAYGVEKDEIADMALWLTDDISDAIRATRANRGRKTSEEILALQPTVATRIAEYLITGN